MKISPFFLLAGLFWALSLDAQIDSRTAGRFGLVYRLTDPEAVLIYQKRLPFDTAWLHTQVDTFHGEHPTRPLPPGHYLLVRALQEGLQIETFSINTLQINLLETKRDFAFTISDSLGHALRDALAWLGAKAVPFDAALDCYRLPKRAKGGFLRVYAGGESLFLWVKPEQSGSFRQRRFAYWRSRGFGKIAWSPVRWSLRTAWRVKTAAARRRYYAEQYLERPFRGYIALNQPRFQPGDTLRVKACLANRRGRPWRKLVDFQIEDARNSRLVVSRTLAPAAPGVFILEFPLGDSLTLDRYYAVRFSEKKKKEDARRRVLSLEFHYEDYLLDEVAYALDAEKTHFGRGEPVALRLTARDALRQPVTDGQVEWVVTTQSVEQFFEPEVAVPDTLWRGRQGFSSTGEALLVLADSVLPAAKMRVQASAFCTNSVGELQTKNLYFTVDRRPWQVVAELAQGFVSLRWNGGPGTAAPDSVLLLEKWPDGHLTVQTLPLPGRARLNPGARAYTAITRGRADEPLLDAYQPASNGVDHAYARAGDTMRFDLYNEHRLSLRYWISRDARVVEAGTTADAHWQWQQAGAAGHAFTLQYTYLWNGATKNQSVNAPYLGDLLQIRLEHPETVQPGASVPVTVHVSDARNRPASGVEVAVGAYNARFGDEDPFLAPDIRVGSSRWPFYYSAFFAQKPEKRLFHLPLTHAWYERLQLDSLLYYRVRYRGEGFYTESFPVTITPAGAAKALPGLLAPADSFYRHRPQFAPYVIRNRRTERVFLIYCNNLPVYYAGTSDDPPYSFFGQYGYNQIKIRTREGQYTLDSVWLEAGQKLEIALDAGRWAAAVEKPLRVHFERRPDTLTAFEQNLLRQTLLLWRPPHASGPHFFWHYADDIHRIIPGDDRWALEVLGPFPPDADLHCYEPGVFYSQFQFEPGFEYEISPGRERLYASAWPFGLARLPYSFSAAQNPGALALGPHDLPAEPAPESFPDYAKLPSGQHGMSALRWRFAAPDSVELVASALLGDTLLGPFRPNVQNLSGLPPGRYRLLLFTTKGLVGERTVRLGRDTLLCVDLKGLAFGPPKTGESWQSLFPPLRSEPDPQPASSQSSRFSQWPGQPNNAVLQGLVTDDPGEPLIGATVKALQGKTLIKGGITDFAGEYRLLLSAGVYDLEFSYTGFMTVRISGVKVLGQQINFTDAVLSDAGGLQEVMIIAYKIPLIEQDRTSAAYTSTYDVRPRTAVVGSQNLTGDDSAPVEDLLPEPVAGTLADSAATGPRTNFRDYAFWQPHLQTDTRGEAFFQADFPDDITGWNVFALGMDRRERAGVSRSSVRAFKPLYAQLAVPRFAVAGDRFEALGRAVNLTGDSLDIRTQFRFGGRPLPENPMRIGSSQTEFTTLQAPPGADTITVGYTLRGSPGTDGEERRIPVLRAGVTEFSGQFLSLEGDTTLILHFDPALGPVTVQARDNALDLLLDDIDYLENYPYACNEQTASRLIAFLLEKQISGYQKRPFVQEKPLRQTLDRLKNNQHPDGSWGWWPGGPPNAWMTMYVLRALQMAADAGYSAATQRDRGLTWLRVHAPALRPADRREAFLLLRESGVNVDCAPLLAAFDSLPARSLDERLNRLYLQQLCGRPAPVDSLERLLQPTLLGGLYCGEESADWDDRRALNTLRAYALARAAGWDRITLGIRRYWLESRPAEQSRNTFETALILKNLVPALLTAGDTLSRNRLTVNEKTMDSFPKTLVFSPGETLRLEKTGDGPLYLAAYQQQFNPDPAPRTDLFELTTRMEQDGRLADELRAGKPAMLVVELLARQYAEYVMIEVPIPAGCAYGDQQTGPLPETHREHFRDRAAIFCEMLPAGRYTFRIPLEPRFGGVFTQNPARAAPMYFPVLYGRNGVQKVKIGAQGQ